MHPASARGRLQALQGQSVLIVGDVMLDQYVWGTVDRISPEAPVPVLHAQRETAVPGGAANVARNVAALGGQPMLVGVRGRDARGDQLAALCREAGIATHLIPDQRPTTAKVRYIAQSQQLLRADWEEPTPLSGPPHQSLLEALEACLQTAQAVVISDYAKGVVCDAVADRLRTIDAPVIVDPRPSQTARYTGMTLMTPNQKEAAAIAGTAPEADPPAAAAQHIALHYTRNVLITCGDRGAYLRTAAGQTQTIPARARQVYDVTGAGDTVVAVLALALSAGEALDTAAELANHAAGLVVGKVGTATVSPAELLADLQEESDAAPL